MSDLTSFVEQLIAEDCASRVDAILHDHPDGVREHLLLSQLDSEGFFEALDPSTPAMLLLFQKHFILFHILYRLKQQLVQNRQGSINISPLSIKKIASSEAETSLDEVDVLGVFYLDLSNLREATAENVNELLSTFWKKYLRNEKRGNALHVLGLKDPVTDKEIIQRYRKLANTHHPDKGGEKDRIQKINEAYTVLIKP